ncbi:MAG TPA: radical SAM family heme chaperone HemW [Puia sp.]|nr:radical SAM family heme chaperone HemW [Puia sp.]
MAGIYLHIPFCKQACNYCNFHFTTSLRNKNDFVAALLKEIVLQKDYLGQEEVSTIYFGGGTPSLLQPGELSGILANLHTSYKISAHPEITLEANPDDINEHKTTEWKTAGINRLSIGVQSFFEDDLRWMNRAHNAQQAINSINIALDSGFDNITIDLIYGTPTLTNEKWQQNLMHAEFLRIPHLSCYALTVEQKTLLHKLIKQKKIEDINTDKQAEQFLMLMNFASNAGYEHYEISNFAMPGKRSRHNSSYWQGKNYLGLGPSAHSFNGMERRWNVANNNRYIEALKQQNILLYEKEELNTTQKLNEYIMISLRTIEGCDMNYIENVYNKQARGTILKNAEKFINSNALEFISDRLILTRNGKLLADGIASDLFFDE